MRIFLPIHEVVDTTLPEFCTGPSGLARKKLIIPRKYHTITRAVLPRRGRTFVNLLPTSSLGHCTKGPYVYALARQKQKKQEKKVRPLAL